MTELRGTCGGDNESDLQLIDVFSGFGVSRETIEEADGSSVEVIEARGKVGEVEDEGEVIHEAGKYVEYCEDAVATPEEGDSDDARLVLALLLTSLLPLVKTLLALGSKVDKELASAIY